MGPGTHVNERIRSNVEPVNSADKASMIHDVNYILAQGNPEKLNQADEKALSRLSILNPFRLIMEMGFSVRQKFHLYEGRNDPEYVYQNALELKQLILQRYDDIHEDDFIA